MFSSKECVGHAVGGAVLGVAVGMMMQKILSPRSAPQPANSADKTRLVCCENVKKRSRSSDLRVPSNRHRNPSHRRPCRSRSASGTKIAEKGGRNLSAPRNSQHKSKHSPSETKLRSTSTEKSEASHKFALKTNRTSAEYILNASTDYPTFESKVPKKSCGTVEVDFNRDSGPPFATESTEYAPLELGEKLENNEPKKLIFDVNNRSSVPTKSETMGEFFFNSQTKRADLESKLLRTADEIETNSHGDSFRDSPATVSTEYLSLALKKKSINPVPAVVVSESRHTDFEFINSETIDCSINATCDTELLSLNTESYREFIETLSTEYLISRDSENCLEGSETPAVSGNADLESSTMLCESTSASIDINIETEMAKCSINASCNTFDEEFDSLRENHSAESTKE